MKKVFPLSILILMINIHAFSQANASYWLNSTPVTGTFNAAFGVLALANNTTGYANAACGNDALRLNTTGKYNQASGYQALYDNTIGNYNTANGYLSLTFNTNGTNNSALGNSALKNNTTGSANSGIGAFSNVSTGNLMASTAIGTFAMVNASYKVRLGANTVTVVEGQVPYSNPSDGRFKMNISESDVKGLEFIKQLRPVVYNFDTRKFQEFLVKNLPDSTQKDYLQSDFAPSTAVRQSGFIAQEVEVAAKKCGYNFNGLHIPENADDNYSIAYSQFVVPLVKAVQEQQNMIEKQQKELDELKALVREISANPSAIKTATLQNELKIYPNPNKGLFTITVNSIDNGMIEIVDSKGLLIQNIKTENGVFTYQVDLTAQPKGTYIINLQTNSGRGSQKIILE
ncbi:MAG: tail fiber domain-containing protein [Bacteroidetes bacterium]|nr:tail fiber domain-containing protein [Bacteroidota bacterium]MBK8143851.1 tail fiber domain-containing protein [Bacteroidota bacterium]